MNGRQVNTLYLILNRFFAVFLLRELHQLGQITEEEYLEIINLLHNQVKIEIVNMLDEEEAVKNEN